VAINFLAKLAKSAKKGRSEGFMSPAGPVRTVKNRLNSEQHVTISVDSRSSNGAGGGRGWRAEGWNNKTTAHAYSKKPGSVLRVDTETAFMYNVWMHTEDRGFVEPT